MELHPTCETGRAKVLFDKEPIDLLVHNASTLGKTPLPILLDTECEDLSQVLEVNVVGPFRLTKVVAGAMALGRRGVVLHISSDAAVNAYPGWGTYGASKAAQDHLSRTWAAELEGTGVSFYAVDPGEMNTRMPSPRRETVYARGRASRYGEARGPV